MIKNHPIVFILVLLLVLLAIGEAINNAMDRMKENDTDDFTGTENPTFQNNNNNTSQATDNTTQAATQPATQTISQVTKVQVTGLYTTAQLKALVPDNISDSLNNLSDEQWQNITNLVNQLPADKFQSLKSQLQNIGFLEAQAINLMSTDSLYNAIISKLQNALTNG